ncbi:TrmH family RNA methyltransferase [Hydrocoleum sp. CS-953]|uniref:TrmH family RNA methyltransferase n=1 Tax=Microcoleaceae TaxID=1892252 RepID=UPI000B9ACA6F|nr:RNA methyltransferase [Hydrocoleum sp. CS-953]OZH52905.1 rRNA methyltransferase [Hydrocoleum sp. CS-953]
MQREEKQQLITYLSQFVTIARREKILSVLQQRTRYITVILEDIYQPHNASAVLRSCDSFGVQDVHIVENKNIFTITQGVTIGSDRWLTLYRYNQPSINNTEECLKKLKSEGYIIAATTLYKEQITIEQLSVNTKVALMFGSEINGLSEYAQNNADVSVKIPMVGFSESFNISVSAALCLYDVMNRLRKEHNNWELTETEKLDLELDWLRKSIKAGELIEKKFLRQKGVGSRE